MVPDEQALWFQRNGADMLRQLGLQRGQWVLDFGCGPGRYTIPLAQIVGPDGLVLAVDRSAEMLQQLRRQAAQRRLSERIRPIQTGGDSRLPEIPPASLHAVLLFDILQHVPGWDALFDSVSAALRPEGRVHVFPAAGPHPGLVDMQAAGRLLARRGLGQLTRRRFRLAHAHEMTEGDVYTFGRATD